MSLLCVLLCDDGGDGCNDDGNGDYDNSEW